MTSFFSADRSHVANQLRAHRANRFLPSSMDTIFPNNPQGRLTWNRCELAATILDQPQLDVTHNPSDIDNLSDAQLLKLHRLADSRAFGPSAIGTDNVRKITKNTVIKPTRDAEGNDIYPAEALAQQLILEQTTIPVPQIYRVSQIQGRYFIAMEHIPGEQLLSVWPRLSWPARVRVALTLRSYVLQLRKVRHPERETIPGPLGVPGQRGLKGYSNLWSAFVPSRGPFDSYAEFTQFLNQRMQILKEHKDRRDYPTADLVGEMDDSEPLVLTHQDLNPRNIIYGDDGRLWLIDFDMTGFYPPWVEFATMRVQSRCSKCANDTVLEGWDTMIPIVCGWYRDQDAWYRRISTALNWRP